MQDKQSKARISQTEPKIGRPESRKREGITQKQNNLERQDYLLQSKSGSVFGEEVAKEKNQEPEKGID